MKLVRDLSNEMSIICGLNFVRSVDQVVGCLTNELHQHEGNAMVADAVQHQVLEQKKHELSD